LPLSPDRHVHSLSVGERQRIEIVRCLLQNPKLLIMDEPTSVLTPQESSKLFETLRRLSAEGVSILFISHKLDEIKALCHRATIMRAGRVTAEVDPRQETAASMAALMIGDELVKPEQRASTDFGEIRLRVNDLSLRADSQFGINLRNVSLQVRGGEVFGIAGVAGNGQIELLSVLSGETLSDSAAIEIMGKAVGKLGPAHRRAQGMTFVPEERLGHGSVPDMSLIENTVLSAHKRMNFLAAGLIDYQAAGEFASEVRQRFKVKSHGVEASAGSLSGGNLQKFIIGREIMQEPDLLIVAHPTWGVDAGAAAAIHQALLDLAQSGVAVLVISQDLDELFAISDRIAVISDGRLSAPQATSTVTIEEIGLLMGGLHDKPGDHDNDNDKGVNNAA